MTGLWLVAWVSLAAPSERSILADLERLDQTLAGAEGALRHNEAARSQAQAELAGLESQLAAARLKKNEMWQHYRRRVQALARLPAGARLVLLGGSSSLSDYLASARLLRWVAQHDRDLHEHFVAESARLASLEEQRGLQRAALDRIVLESRARRDTVASDRRDRADLLKSVRDERSKAQALAREKRQAQEKLRSMVQKQVAGEGLAPAAAAASRGLGGGASMRVIQRLPVLPDPPSARAHLMPGAALKGAFAQNRGLLPWPAAGPVRVAFGQRVELTFGTVTSHNGWDIGAPAGARVQAIARGKVVYANWLRGYGQMVIVDHGDQFHSVAAHLASVDVAVGDSVDAGQILGSVGDTGSLRGTVLYFEIRHHGTPVDPRPWLRR